MPPFIPGLELSRRFYWEAVRPLLDTEFPGLPHAAGQIGTGSEVLGFDTEMSTDHGWGPSVQLFLREGESGLAAGIRDRLSRQLPLEFCGYPVRFARGDGSGSLEPDAPGGGRMLPVSVRGFFQEYLAYDIEQLPDAIDWLTFPAQKLRTVASGAVYHDGVGELSRVRERLAWYPHDVWLYLLASGWQRIGQEDHLMPRAGYVDDELGSVIIGSRLVRDVIGLCFLMERQYAPYPKWFGTAFQQLACAADLTPSLRRAQTASTWREREAALGEAYVRLAALHNTLGITDRMPEALSPFHTRPFQVIQADDFAGALRAGIVDPEVQRIASRRLIGSIDQFSDSTDLRTDTCWRAVLRGLYLSDRELPNGIQINTEEHGDLGRNACQGDAE